MRICSTCKEEKELDAFHWKNKEKGIKSHTCKECRKIFIRKHYEENKDYYKNKIKKSNSKRRQKYSKKFLELKENLKCVKCGEDHPAALDFHHVDRRDKDEAVSRLLSYSWKRVLEEIDKCVVLCSNCHRKLHYEERNKYPRSSIE